MPNWEEDSFSSPLSQFTSCHRKDFVYTSVFSSVTCCDSPWRLVFIKLHPDKCHLCSTDITRNECTWCITLHCTHSWMLWWWRQPGSSRHISYRNAWGSLFHFDEHIDYLNQLLKCKWQRIYHSPWITAIANNTAGFVLVWAVLALTLAIQICYLLLDTGLQHTDSVYRCETGICKQEMKINIFLFCCLWQMLPYTPSLLLKRSYPHTFRFKTLAPFSILECPVKSKGTQF